MTAPATSRIRSRWRARVEADGIAAICATPHIRHDHDVRIDELPARLAELAAAIRKAGCTTQVLPGGEVAVSALDGLEDGELHAITLGGSGRWILLEPAPGSLDDAFDQAVGRLQARGFRAVIAHPERHAAPDLVERLRRLTQRGSTDSGDRGVLCRSDDERRDADARAGGRDPRAR